MTRSFIGSAIVAGLAVLHPGVAIAKTPDVRRLDLKYTCEIAEVPPGTTTLDLWIPVPSTDDRQTVRLVNEDGLAPGRLTTDKKFGNRMYYRRFTAPFVGGGKKEDAAEAQPAIRVEFRYEVEVREATVAAAKALIPSRQVVPGPEFAAYLGDTKMIPIKGRISELARNIDLADGEPLRAGRRIYDYLVDTMVYNYQAPGAGKGNAVWACDSKTGDCTDYHSVFIGVCRWRGIPADHVFGLTMPPEKLEGDIKYCHCWAQFWVADVGWVPIDASRADKFPSEREYYFGTLGTTWLTLAHGRDVVLEPPQQGPPINMFEAPLAEVDGLPFDSVRWTGHYKDRPDSADSAAAK